MTSGERIRSALRALAPAAGEATESALLLAGAALIAYGAWLAYRPAGFVVGGALLLVGVILRARAGGG